SGARRHGRRVLQPASGRQDEVCRCLVYLLAQGEEITYPQPAAADLRPLPKSHIGPQIRGLRGRRAPHAVHDVVTLSGPQLVGGIYGRLSEGSCLVLLYHTQHSVASRLDRAPALPERNEPTELRP